MKTLYEAASAVEAHMVQDLLMQEGIASRLDGEFLQGAIGELPAAGLVRLVVDESDYLAARAVVDRWETAQPRDGAPRPAPRATRGFLGFAIGLLVGVTAAYGFFRSPVTVDGIDHNRDGLLDEKWTYSASGSVVRTEIDRNLDGKPDYIAHYDARGQIEWAEADDDFNGVFETRLRFRWGNVEVSEVDTDGDQFADLITHYTHGVATSSEYIDPSTGLPVRVDYFRLGKLVKAEIDTDRDGRLDKRQLYNGLEEVTATQPIAAP
jgi:hypothetical protein